MQEQKILRFPDELGRYVNEGHAHMRIEVEERYGDSTITPYNIHTYMPIGISVGDGQNYTNLDLGITGQGTKLLAERITGSKTGTFTQQDLILGSAETVGKFGSELDSLTGGFLNTEETRRLGLLSKGLALNPNTLIAYEGPTVRTFSFSFKFISESAKESETAKEIINVFRNYMYPDRVGVLALQYPAVFHLKFYNGKKEENLHMPIIKPCYLTNLNTTYNPTGNTFHRDGAPVELDMELTFTETKSLVREDLYGEDYPGNDPEERITNEGEG